MHITIPTLCPMSLTARLIQLRRKRDWTQQAPGKVVPTTQATARRAKGAGLLTDGAIQRLLG